MKKKVSMQAKLIRTFLAISILPILILSFFSYYNMTSTLKSNTENLTNTSLKQVGDNLQIWLESYEDLTFQIYTNDDMVAWIDKLNNEQDVSVVKNQMRRYLRGLLNTKEYIRSITVITSEGMVITYDQLTSATYVNSWMKNFSLTKDNLYQKVSSDNFVHIFSTEFGTRFANKDYYLFHIAHRIIDYKNLDKKNGIVIVSIDEALLQNVCRTSDEKNTTDNFNFIVDADGTLISYMDQEKIGNKLVKKDSDLEKRREKYKEFIEKEEFYNQDYTGIYTYYDKNLNWDIVNVRNQNEYMVASKRQMAIAIIISLLMLLGACVLTLVLSGHLAESVKKVVASIQKAREGNLSVRIEADETMPIEIEMIAVQFNDMLTKLEESQAKEKEAGERQRQAEIKALEAQINPHFLYNTLDTINWMAIDKDEFHISNAISSLAKILRYAITNSNAEVCVKEEIDWLKKYIYLQQFRLKNTFVCNINVAPEVTESRIHKLLLQPFVENAIVHGFGDKKQQHVLDVIIKKEQEMLKIIIQDNGKGIDPLIVAEFNKGNFEEINHKDHIGMENAITRLQMYYRDMATIEINSQVEEGTKITVTIPFKGEVDN